MKISIITACWNSVATIRDAMESVARQKVGEDFGRRERKERKEGGGKVFERPAAQEGGSRGGAEAQRNGGKDGVELEYIVVDGGSTDGTVEVIREFEGEVRRKKEEGRSGEGFRFRWISEKDRGMYDAINKGIRMATGEVVGILNADDVLAGDDIVAKIAEEFGRGEVNAEERRNGEREREGDSRVERGEHGEEVGGSATQERKPCRDVEGDGVSHGERGEHVDGVECVYGKVCFVRELGGRIVRRCFAKMWSPWMLQWGYMPPHPAIFIRKECFEKWGYYEPDRREYRIAADYELLIRFFRVHRMRARYVRLYTTIMRTGGVSTRDVEARKKLNEEIIKANRVNGYFCCWPMLLPKYAIKIWEFILPKMGII